MTTMTTAILSNTSKPPRKQLPKTRDEADLKTRHDGLSC